MVAERSTPEDLFAGVLPTQRVDRNGQPFVVRLLRAEDRPGLEDFYDAFEPKRAAQGLPPPGRDRIGRWLDSILGEGVHLIGEAESRLIGHGLLMPTARADVYEWAIFLDREHRGRGIGTAINRIATDVGRRLGLRKLWLSVEPHNRAALRSYENAGYRYLSSAIFSPEAEMELPL